MANPYINVYMGNPTVDGTDGTQISTDGAQTSPLSAVLDATKEESKVMKIALRCEAGYKVKADGTGNTVTIDFLDGSGNHSTKWGISETQYASDTEALADIANFTNTKTSTRAVANKNVIFWVVAKSTKDEVPSNDTAIKMQIKATIEPA